MKEKVFKRVLGLASIIIAGYLHTVQTCKIHLFRISGD